jgi:hypothetical protein
MVGEYSHRISSSRQMPRRVVMVSRAGPFCETCALQFGLVASQWLALYILSSRMSRNRLLTEPCMTGCSPRHAGMFRIFFAAGRRMEIASSSKRTAPAGTNREARKRPCPAFGILEALTTRMGGRPSSSSSSSSSLSVVLIGITRVDLLLKVSLAMLIGSSNLNFIQVCSLRCFVLADACGWYGGWY